MIGKTYLEAGSPVVVLARWSGIRCPRNVLIERATGELVVRPFRGLRKPAPERRGPVPSPGEDRSTTATSPVPAA